MKGIDRVVCVVGLTLALGAGSCGGKDDDKATLDLGVESGTAVNSLTQEQATAICDKLTEYFKDLLGGTDLCNFAGAMMNMVPAGAGGQTCAQMVTACKQSTSSVSSAMAAYVPTGKCSTVIASSTARVNCTATVGEITACWQEMKSVMTTVFGSVDCSTTKQSLATSLQKLGLSSVQACEAVATKCAALNAG